MPAIPMLPAGPGDCEQRLKYLNGRGGVELKTGRISEGNWARMIAQTVKGWGNMPVTWHVPEEWTARIGFSDFDISGLIAKMSAVEPMILDGLIDAIVFHCGAMRWVEVFDSEETLEERYTSRFTCQEILDQIETLVCNFSVLVDHFGPENILIENTPISMFRESFQTIDGKPVLVGMDNFLGPQLGTIDTVLYLSRMTGAGVVLDTGHFTEFWTLLNRRYDYHQLSSIGIEYLEPDEIEFYRLCGYINRKGSVPYIPRACCRDLLWCIQHFPIRLFHLDSCRSSFYWGKPDCERPILTQADAQLIHLDEIIQVARANPDCLGLLEENVGSDIWPFATERPNDWEGKQQTFEFLERAIAV